MYENGPYSVTVTAPAPPEVPYMVAEIPTELDLPEEEAPISWLWLAIPAALLLFAGKR